MLLLIMLQHVCDKKIIIRCDASGDTSVITVTNIKFLENKFLMFLFFCIIFFLFHLGSFLQSQIHTQKFHTRPLYRFFRYSYYNDKHSTIIISLVWNTLAGFLRRMGNLLQDLATIVQVGESS